MHTELVVIYTLFRSQLEKLSLLVLANPGNNALVLNVDEMHGVLSELHGVLNVDKCMEY
jgi:hypothetical protein